MMSKIKLVSGLFFAAWLFASPLLAQSMSWSMGTFRNVGVVDQISRKTIFIDDTKYLLSPTAKFSMVGKGKASIRLLKKNQMVGFSTITINNRHLVDQLWLIPENERGLYRPQP
jgi:hypothetical protein